MTKVGEIFNRELAIAEKCRKGFRVARARGADGKEYLFFIDARIQPPHNAGLGEHQETE